MKLNCAGNYGRTGLCMTAWPRLHLRGDYDNGVLEFDVFAITARSEACHVINVTANVREL